YRRALDAAVREYERLIAQHTELEARIAQLRHSIAALTKLCGYEPTVPIGLTDACRLVLRNAETPLTALEIRDRLKTIGVDLHKDSKPPASIHTSPKAMHEGGEVREGDREASSRTAYSFVLPSGTAIAIGYERREWPTRRHTGEGLCPPKDRKK